MASPPTPVDDGYGCRETVLTLALLAFFVVVAGTVGVSMALGPGCSGVCERVGFGLYGAALPISAVFAAVAGDLPIAWPLDATFWLITAFGLSRRSERSNRSIAGVVVAAIVAALAFGAVISLFITTTDVS